MAVQGLYESICTQTEAMLAEVAEDMPAEAAEEILPEVAHESDSSSTAASSWQSPVPLSRAAGFVVVDPWESDGSDNISETSLFD